MPAGADTPPHTSVDAQGFHGARSRKKGHVMTRARMATGGRVAGKVALITGAAKGQGRSHAIRLAEEGASIFALDICAQIPGIDHPMGTEEDLAETAKAVEAVGGQIETLVCDVRDLEGMQHAADSCVERFGGVDIVCANAGIASHGATWELTRAAWQDMIDVQLTGVWHTVRATLPPMIAAGRGGSIIITSSSAGLVGIRNLSHYSAAKTAVVGYCRAVAQEVGEYSIRINTVHPSAVPTDLAINAASLKLFLPDHPDPGPADVAPLYQSMHMLPIPWVETVDISNAVLWLASDEARYVTGIALPVDAGLSQKYPG